MSDVQCTHVKPDGERCAGRARDAGLCLFHDPAQTEYLREARSRGGKQKHAGDVEQVVATATEGPRAILAICRNTIRRVRKGTMEARAASAIASLCGVALKAIAQADTDKRVDELDERTRPLKGLTPEQLEAIVTKGLTNGADSH